MFVTVPVLSYAVMGPVLNAAENGYSRDSLQYGTTAQEPLKGADSNLLPRLSVKGNRFVDPQGNPVLIRGVAIIDPSDIEKQGHWNKNHFEQVKKMGAVLVRIPIHPSSWRERTPNGYLKLLDQAVEWCTELRMYVMIDWHSIGNLRTGLFQNPMYNTTQTETFEFWRTIAGHYRGKNPTVAFYEIFNEPTSMFNQLGPVSWEEWKRFNEDVITLIRAFDRQTIPLVAGFDWAYDLAPVRYAPIAAEGIGYVVHPYPDKRSKPWEGKWEEDFGFVAGQYPVFATEFGFGGGKFSPAEYEQYGTTIVNFLEERGISWAVWVFDTNWRPELLKSIEPYSFTPFGEFFKNILQMKRAQQDSLKKAP